MDDGGRHRAYRSAVSAAIHLRIQTDGCDSGRVLQSDVFHPRIADVQHGCALRIVDRECGQLLRIQQS